jgi:hypothetical protein
MKHQENITKTRRSQSDEDARLQSGSKVVNAVCKKKTAANRSGSESQSQIDRQRWLAMLLCP